MSANTKSSGAAAGAQIDTFLAEYAEGVVSAKSSNSRNSDGRRSRRQCSRIANW